MDMALAFSFLVTKEITSASGNAGISYVNRNTTTTSATPNNTTSSINTSGNTYLYDVDSTTASTEHTTTPEPIAVSTNNRDSFVANLTNPTTAAETLI